MSIDVENEQVLTLTQAAKLPFLTRNGRRPHVATMYRWASRGVRGLRLESCQIGGSLCTTREAVLRFIERLSRPDQQISNPTPARRQREIESAERELTAAGL